MKKYLIISFFIFLIFQNLFSLINTISIYQPSEVFKEFGEEILLDQKIKDGIIKLFQDAYAYTELSKNPPQPSFSNDYFTQYDIIEELSKIDITNSRNRYELYRDIKMALAPLKDPNIDMVFSNYFLDFDFYEFVFPIEFYVLKNGTESKIYCRKAETNNFLIRNFFVGNIGDIITENENQPIKTINYKDPIEYIESFGDEYNLLKNPHANFAYKLSIINNNKKRQTLKNYPLSLRQLNDFTIIYENNNYFKTNLLLIKTASLPSLLITKSNKNEVYNIYNSFFKKRILKEEKIDYSPYYQNQNKVFLTDISGYKYDDKFFCKVDSEKEVNIYYIKSFSADNELEENKYLETIDKCVELFDSNTYSIIVINRISGGENLFISHYLLELISPLITVNFYGAYRKTESLFNLKESAINQDSSIKDCSYINKNYLKSKTKTIDYGNGIIDKLTQPFIVKGFYTRKKISIIKEKLKNKRKPTEILVYTDGYSFSAAGAFMKYLQYNGGAITAGYFSHPLKSNIPFDSGSNPSILFSAENLKDMVTDYGKNVYKEIKFKLPVGQLFYNSNLALPLEYDINTVDEMVNIYEVDENNLTNFIVNGKEILEKYKNSCIKNNKKILLASNECDGQFGNINTHGGFICGDNGQWSKTCKALYCDNGYIFDEEKNECVIDICYVYDVSKKEKKSKNIGLILFIVIICLLVLIAIVLLIIRILGRLSERFKTPYNSI